MADRSMVDDMHLREDSMQYVNSYRSIKEVSNVNSYEYSMENKRADNYSGMENKHANNKR